MANDPESEAMLLRLNEAGLQRFPAEALSGDTPQIRMGGLLQQAHTIDRDLLAERSQDLESENTQDLQQAYSHSEEYDYDAVG